MIYGRLRPSYGHRNVGPGYTYPTLRELNIVNMNLVLENHDIFESIKQSLHGRGHNNKIEFNHQNHT